MGACSSSRAQQAGVSEPDSVPKSTHQQHPQDRKNLAHTHNPTHAPRHHPHVTQQSATATATATPRAADARATGTLKSMKKPDDREQHQERVESSRSSLVSVSLDDISTRVKENATTGGADTENAATVGDISTRVKENAANGGGDVGNAATGGGTTTTTTPCERTPARTAPLTGKNDEKERNAKRRTAPTTPVTPIILDALKMETLKAHALNSGTTHSLCAAPHPDQALASAKAKVQTPHYDEGGCEAGTATATSRARREGRRAYEATDVWTRLASTPLKGKCGKCHGVRRRPSQQPYAQKPAFR